MITFKQFFLESNQTSDDEITPLEKLLIEKCMPALKIMYNSDKPFIRGVKQKAMPTTSSIAGPLLYSHGAYADITGYVIQNTKSRQPKDTPKWAQALIDDIAFVQIGWKPRSEGVFMTIDFGMASEYGKAHLAVPVGNFRMATINNVKDLTVELFPDANLHGAVRDIGVAGGKDYWFELGVKQPTRDDEEDFIKAYMKDHPYSEVTSNDVDTEISVLCDSYILVDFGDNPYFKIHAMLDRLYKFAGFQ
jgi:hypothetical protein